MQAMVLAKLGRLSVNPKPLQMMQVPDPVAREKEILVKITTCGVCHTELDEIEGRAPPPPPAGRVGAPDRRYRGGTGTPCTTL